MKLSSIENIIELLQLLNEKQADKLQMRVMDEVDLLSQRLAGRVKERLNVMPSQCQKLRMK